MLLQILTHRPHWGLLFPRLTGSPPPLWKFLDSPLKAKV